MKCIESRRMITPFIQKKLSIHKKEAFIKHIESCEDCKEELDIYYTVYKTIDSLEYDHHKGDYDFRKQLEEEIKAEKNDIYRRKAFRGLRILLVFVAELFLVLALFTGYEVQKGQRELTSFQKAIHLMRYGFSEDAPVTVEIESENIPVVPFEEEIEEIEQILEDKGQILPPPEHFLYREKSEKSIHIKIPENK